MILLIIESLASDCKLTESSNSVLFIFDFSILNSFWNPLGMSQVFVEYSKSYCVADVVGKKITYF